MSEVNNERRVLLPVTEEQVVEASEKLTSDYSNVFWLVDFEGVILPKAFRGIERGSLTSYHEDDLVAIEKGIYRLPVNEKLIKILEKMLGNGPQTNWLVEGSSLVSIPEAEIQSHIPTFRFGIQRSRSVLDSLAERTVGRDKNIKPGSMPSGSLLVVLNDEMPPMGLYKHIKSKDSRNYDSYDICEVPVPVFRGQHDNEYHQNTLNVMFKAFDSQVIKRPINSPTVTTWSTGSGLSSMAPSGFRIRREGD